MVAQPKRIPRGPAEKYNTSQNLLTWISDHFEQFGDIYKASIYDRSVYVVSDPKSADYVLRENWQNDKKGLAIKRVALLLGNGLMVSEGDFWKRQRRTIQPAFHQEAVGALKDVITAANLELRKQWQRAAQEKRAVNVTRDISLMILKVVLISIFGETTRKLPRSSVSFPASRRGTCSSHRYLGLWERSSAKSPLEGGQRTKRLGTSWAC